MGRPGNCDLISEGLEDLFAAACKLVLFCDSNISLPPVLPDLIQHRRDESDEDIDCPDVLRNSILDNVIRRFTITGSSSRHEPI
jgi:hypothetical protein